MGFFNDLGKKTSEATSKITKETKLKFKINDRKGKINDIYEEIGKKVYEKYLIDEAIDVKEDVRENCEKIDELAKEIEEARQEILKLNQKRQCCKCYAEIDKDATFCPKCGTKQEPEAEVVENAPETAEEEIVEEVEKQEQEEILEEQKEEEQIENEKNN